MTQVPLSALLTSVASISRVYHLLSHTHRSRLGPSAVSSSASRLSGYLSIRQRQSLIPAPFTLSKGLLGMGDQAGPRQEAIQVNKMTSYTNARRAGGLGEQSWGRKVVADPCPWPRGHSVGQPACSCPTVRKPRVDDEGGGRVQREAHAPWRCTGFKSYPCQPPTVDSGQMASLIQASVSSSVKQG